MHLAMTRDPDSSRDGPPRGGAWGNVWRWLKRLAAASVVLAAIAAAVLYVMLSEYEKTLPKTSDLKDYAPPQLTRVLARDGTPLAELFIERRTVVPIEQIPKAMKVAVLAAEDADFYKHEGLDYFGMLRALIVNVRSGRMKQGGSTITQQVVKNVMLTHERTFARKAQEVLLARRIEQELSKDEILELYLNHIYFGHGRYGVEEAARYYFGKGIADVTLAEAALIAALPKGPSLYSPRVDYDRARARRDQVLDQLVLKAFVSGDAADDAKGEPIALAPAPETLPELAPEVIAEVKRTLTSLVGPEARQGGYTVTTTIDPTLQAAARKAVRDNLDAYAERHGLTAPIKKKPGKPFQGTPSGKGHHVYLAVVTGADDDHDVLRVKVGTVDGKVRLAGHSRYNPKRLAASKFAETGALLRVSPVVERGMGADGVPSEFRLELGPESALVAIDPTRREIRALVGSYEAVRGGLDRASFAHRQPGSTFKAFVYAQGIQSRRLTAATVVPIRDAKSSREGEPPETLRVRAAIARSVNEAAEWALDTVGAEAAVSFAHAAGITSKLGATRSLALGAYEVTPRELAIAYSTFASGGTFEAPTLVTRIVGPDGSEIALPTTVAQRRVLEPSEAYVVTHLLGSVIDSGTGRRAKVLGLPLAGKTGTSNEAKDAWFAGYSPRMVAVVWTGYDDAVALGRREQGASAALPAWIDFMRAAHAGTKTPAWSRPDGVIEIDIDPRTGLLPHAAQEDTVREIFLAGTEPSVVAEPSEGAGGADPDLEVPPDSEPIAGPGDTEPGDTEPASAPKATPAPDAPEPTAAPEPTSAPQPIDTPPPPF
jgi:penicillin-binding protein 1A